MVAQKKLNFRIENITKILVNNYADVVKEFYEMQSSYLTSRYTIHKNLETATVIQCFIRSAHLEIVRQRETNLDHSISFSDFVTNLKTIDIPSHKIVYIVNSTGIPKETVRRKVKNLIEKKIIFKNKNNEYLWNMTTVEREKEFINTMNIDINMISKFIYSFMKYLNLDLSKKQIAEEIRSQFSFYMYHFLNCQLNWLKMWQTKLKDVDLIFIAIQALIPTIEFLEKKEDTDLNLDNLNKIIGKTSAKYQLSNVAVSATSISDVSGIPRATCIRKLDKLVSLGMLVREVKTKRYYVNPAVSDRTKNITKKENIIFTINSFSSLLSIVISALIRNRKY